MFTVNFSVKRNGCDIDCEVTGEISGSHGQIDEVYDVVCKCLCGHEIELTPDELYSAEIKLEEMVQQEAVECAIDRAEMDRDWRE